MEFDLLPDALDCLHDVLVVILRGLLRRRRLALGLGDLGQVEDDADAVRRGGGSVQRRVAMVPHALVTAAKVSMITARPHPPVSDSEHIRA